MRSGGLEKKVEFEDLINRNFCLKKIFSNVESKFLKKRISGITNNSLNVKNNFLFLAIKGSSRDGNDYIDQAKKKGSSLIISSYIEGPEIITLKSINLSMIYSLLCSVLYEKKPDNIIGVTGTNGKTSVVEFCRQIWDLTGWKSASMGTLGTKVSGEALYNSDTENLTTYDPSIIHKELYELHNLNVSHLSMEVSSHGIAQKRLHGINFVGGVFTNLSHDHIDYHKTFQNYFETKKTFFTEHLKPGAIVAINLDDEFGFKIFQEIKNKPFCFINYGRHKYANLRIIEAIQLEKFWQLKIKYNDTTIETNLGMLGEFQIYNALAAAAVCIGLNMNLNFVLKSLAYIKNIPGRMQILSGHPNNALVIIDYAHTPDALQKAISSIKLHLKGKLYTLFGCGGERDFEKRELMGKISKLNSNFTIITDDNPRKENPKKIRDQILKGCPLAIEVAGRDNAIKKGISLLKHNDVLLIAGKGHETTQTIGIESLPFDDFSVAKLAIENLKNGN